MSLYWRTSYSLQTPNFSSAPRIIFSPRIELVNSKCFHLAPIVEATTPNLFWSSFLLYIKGSPKLSVTITPNAASVLYNVKHYSKQAKDPSKFPSSVWAFASLSDIRKVSFLLESQSALRKILRQLLKLLMASVNWNLLPFLYHRICYTFFLM